MTISLALTPILALAACGAQPGEFTSVSAGGYHTCGVKTDGAVVCWGSDEHGQSTPPIGKFATVSAEMNHTCGVRTDGLIACWGSIVDVDGFSVNLTQPPTGKFAAVSAGGYHTCGVRADASVACWGVDYDGQATPPTGEFASVSAGALHTCGVRTDASVACWGEVTREVSSPPSGELASVSAGHRHTCGVRTDASVACWGLDWNGKAIPSSDEFVTVSSGALHTCGVKTDYSVACWGDFWHGQITSPSEQLSSANCDSKVAQAHRRTSPWPPSEDLSGVEFNFEVMSGQKVEMRLTQRNVTNETMTFFSSEYGEGFFVVALSSCEAIWGQPPGSLFRTARRELGPNEERTISAIWD